MHVLTSLRDSFIGSIVRNRRMVKAYSYMTILIFILGSVATGFSLYLTWSERSFCTTIDGTRTCLESHLSTGSKIGFTVGAIVQWLIDLCEYPFLHRCVFFPASAGRIRNHGLLLHRYAHVSLFP